MDKLKQNETPANLKIKANVYVWTMTVYSENQSKFFPLPSYCSNDVML